ncbi:DNA internalization-related competence protein ComEC/Rec2 [Thalassotalea sediminis]|uniref:DNA internalization-related competence protein ComEC/Rec2 n=1 Tax=Thalassotalea sediminis TaxID=1759089 RepID=UPI00257404A6|nr:DNA internalization-related competence protein ComEC/Rec2 [Thalassotalea sediminis]
MDRWLLSFIAGALLSLFLPIVPSIFYVVLFTVLSLFICIIFADKRIGLVFLGMAWVIYQGASYESIWKNNGIALQSLHKSPLITVGEVLTIVQDKDNIQRFNFLIKTLSGKQLVQPIKVRLRWKKGNYQLLQGQEWRLNIKLKPAYGLANSGGFHYQTWLRQQNIHATGYVVKAFPPIFSKPSLRQYLFNHYQRLTKPDPQNALLQALTFGIKHNISDQQWQVLNATATQHLIAISGLHLGVVAMLSFALSKLILNVLTMRSLHTHSFLNRLTINSQTTAITVLTIAIVTFYAYIAGFSQPTLRAATMLIILWSVKLLGGKVTLTRLMLITVFLIIMYSPFSLLSGSFWLSVAAVTTILFYLWRFGRNKVTHQQSLGVKTRNSVVQAFWFQSFLILAILPLTMAIQHQVSLVAILANLIAVPWVSLVCVPLTLLSVVVSIINETVAIYVITLAQSSLHLLWLWLTIISEQTWATVEVSQIAWLSLTCIIVMCIAMLLYVNRKTIALVMFGIGMLGVLALSFSRYKSLDNANWYVDVLDVGQGLSIVIRSAQHTIIYDTGATYPSGFSMTEVVLLPYLRYHGIADIDLLIISHDDNDHAGGLEKLLSAVNVKQLIFNQKQGNRRCLRGQVEWLAHLKLTFLHPYALKAESNDDSCVVKVSDGNTSVLLTGDISTRTEKMLVNKDISGLNSTILVAPHHGSKTSSSSTFIDAVSPENVVFSAGFLNQWNMPNNVVTKRYLQRRINVYSTAEQGLISVAISPQGYDIETFRQHHWPYWFAN